jgi:hypothetical protein
VKARRRYGRIIMLAVFIVCLFVPCNTNKCAFWYFMTSSVEGD